jgi:glyoxylate/hydroxypyruvate reductase A
MSAPLRITAALGSMKPEPWLDALNAAFAQAGIDADVALFDGRARDARYAIVWLPPPELFTLETNLRAVFNVGAGVEGLLANPALPATLPVLRLVDAGMAPKMAEYVCFFLARITRGLDRFGGPQALRDWHVDRPRGTPPTVGVMGLGAIGAQIAHAATVFGYPVIGWSRTPRRIPGVRCFAGTRALDAFLAQSSIVVDVLPLTRETENLLDARRLAQLPRGAHLINIGRGGTIVDADLIAALDGGQLASATLDVFRTEPLPPGHPFWHHPRVTVTPHLSGPTPREPAAAQIAAAIRQLEAGTEASSLPGFVDRARGY